MQTVQTKIRLLLEEQSDQGLHCLQSICTIWLFFSMESHLRLNFRVMITKNIFGVQK